MSPVPKQAKAFPRKTKGRRRFENSFLKRFSALPEDALSLATRAFSTRLPIELSMVIALQGHPYVRRFIGRAQNGLQNIMDRWFYRISLISLARVAKYALSRERSAGNAR